MKSLKVFILILTVLIDHSRADYSIVLNKFYTLYSEADGFTSVWPADGLSKDELYIPCNVVNHYIKKETIIVEQIYNGKCDESDRKIADMKIGNLYYWHINEDKLKGPCIDIKCEDVLYSRLK